MLSILEAKKRVSDKYGFIVIEETDLGKYKGNIVKAEARLPDNIALLTSLDNSMKLIAIAHETGHLLDYKKKQKEYLLGKEEETEKRAWKNGLPIAIELGIREEYIAYQRIHLEKIKRYSQ